MTVRILIKYVIFAWTALSGFGRALAGLSSLIPTPPCSGNTTLSKNNYDFRQSRVS